MSRVLFLVILVLLVFVPSSQAEEYNAATKLGRGLTNAASCWIEVPKQIYLVSQEREPLTGLIYGTIRGVGYTIVRAAAGVYDTALFLVPPYDQPILVPEFVFEGWE